MSCKEFVSYFRLQMYVCKFLLNILLTRYGGNLGEGQLQEYLLLIVDNVHPGPINGYDNIILR